MIIVGFFKPWARWLNLLMFSSSTQGSIVESHVTTKLGGLAQSLLSASSAPTVAPFHGFCHLLANMGLVGVKMASPEWLVHVVDNWIFLSVGLSSFKSSPASFHNITVVVVGTVITRALELAHIAFCHIPFARKTPSGRETDSMSWWKAEEGCGHFFSRTLMALCLLWLQTEISHAECFIRGQFMNFLGARTSLCFIQFFFCQNYVS